MFHLVPNLPHPTLNIAVILPSSPPTAVTAVTVISDITVRDPRHLYPPGIRGAWHTETIE